MISAVMSSWRAWRCVALHVDCGQLRRAKIQGADARLVHRGFGPDLRSAVEADYQDGERRASRDRNRRKASAPTRGRTMTRNNAVRWLRASYWAGAALDALAALSMLVPSLFAATNGLPDFHPGLDYRYAMGMGDSLMLGWTALLLWADRKPLERKGVLLLPCFRSWPDWRQMRSSRSAPAFCRFRPRSRCGSRRRSSPLCSLSAT